MITHTVYKTIYLALVLTNVVILASDHHQEQTDDHIRGKTRDSYILLFSNLAFNIDLLLKLCAF